MAGAAAARRSAATISPARSPAGSAPAITVDPREALGILRGLVERIVITPAEGAGETIERAGDLFARI